MITDQEVEVFLEHYGVKGMKWGVRKDKLRSSIAARKTAKKARKTAKKSAKEERKEKSQLKLGEAAAVALLATPVALIPYKIFKVSAARKKQKVRDAGGGAKEQYDVAAKVSVGRTVAVGVLGTPLTALGYYAGKKFAASEVRTFKKK